MVRHDAGHVQMGLSSVKSRLAMDRKSLAIALDEWMTTGYNHLLGTDRHKRGHHLLKTYLVEANIPRRNGESLDVASFFERSSPRSPVDVASTDDHSIFQLRIGKAGVPFFLDALDGRFWVLHSISPAADSDKAIRGLILGTRNLDSFWLPTHQMEDWIGKLGVPRVLTTKFAVATGIYQESIPEEEFLDDSLVFRIGALGDARPRLNAYRESPILAANLALWSASIARRWSDGDQLTTSIVTASGKVTARGNSFRLHEEIVDGLRARYADLIEEWEGRFRLRWSETDGRLTPAGETAVIAFPERQSQRSLEQVISVLFSCAEPFRLSGTPIARGDSGHYVVKAVDLHTNHKVDFEITPGFLRAYLHSDTCGNVLARLLTNLQHYVDARITLA